MKTMRLSITVAARVGVAVALLLAAAALPAPPAAAAASTALAWSWGANASGQLGDGTHARRTIAHPVPGMAPVVEVAASASHTLALDAGGRVWAWGSNTDGQLGDGTTRSRPAPAAVNALTDVVAVAAGERHSLALRRDGTVWAWGMNADGRLGDGTTVDRHEPARVIGLGGVVAIATRGMQSFAVRDDGTLWVWGWLLASPPEENTPDSYAPFAMPHLNDVTAVAAGLHHTLALRSDGTVWAWGLNSHGQLGDGTTMHRGHALPVSGLTDVVAVAAGAQHSMALREDGTTWAWGRNSDGQLGDGTRQDSTTPAAVPGLTEVKALAAGADHTIALDETGAAWAWGDNAAGQLGDGSIEDRSAPTPITDLTGVSSVAAGGSHSVALRPGAPVAPGTPTGVAATAADGSATVTWSAAPDGGSPITSYVVAVSPGSTTTTVSAEATVAEITDLTNGTSYRFAVRATNALGTSAWSDLSAPVMHPTAPGAPRDVTAAGPCTLCGAPWSESGPTIDVSWRPPTVDGGSPITGYRITRQPGAVTTAVGDVRAWTATGLSYGTTYTFTVTAINAVGESEPSAPSPEVTPLSAPAAPSAAVATAADGSAHLEWIAPPDGGSTVIGYEVAVTPSGTSISLDGAETSVTIPQLANGTQYAFTVRAANQVGESPWSPLSNWVTPAATAALPVTGLSVTPRFDSANATAPRPRARLTWSNNGAPDAVKVRWTDGSRARSVTVTPAPTRYTVTGLTSGRAYTFTVRAVKAGRVSDPATVKMHGSAIDATAKVSAGTTVVRGELSRAGTATPLGGQDVHLQVRRKRADGSYSRWSEATSPVRTTPAGAYTFRHPIPSGAQYRVLYAGAGRNLGSLSREQTVR